jgi:isoleucyl-tRNA synthetase
VLRDFKAPEGTAPDDLDANGDGEVLAVLDLRSDDSLLEAGLAREVCPRLAHVIVPTACRPVEVCL